jgi:hypothetical protein
LPKLYDLNEIGVYTDAGDTFFSYSTDGGTSFLPISDAFTGTTVTVGAKTYALLLPVGGPAGGPGESLTANAIKFSIGPGGSPLTVAEVVALTSVPEPRTGIYLALTGFTLLARRRRAWRIKRGRSRSALGVSG